MSTDILTSLELDKKCDSRKKIIIKELSGCDSSFITSCVLGHCIKNNHAVLVISSHNSLTHYHNVGLKMNYNLQRASDNGLINFFNIGDYMVQNILNNEVPCQEKLLNEIKNRLKLLNEKYATVNIIMDGLSHLFDMQFTLREVNKICEEIMSLVQEDSFIIIHCHVAIEHDITSVMANLLSHKVQILVEVESLTSGLSADVSGHLTIRRPGLRYHNENMYIMQQKPSQYLFKLFDRGVKLLAPGTV